MPVSSERESKESEINENNKKVAEETDNHVNKKFKRVQK